MLIYFHNALILGIFFNVIFPVQPPGFFPLNALLVPSSNIYCSVLYLFFQKFRQVFRGICEYFWCYHFLQVIGNQPDASPHNLEDIFYLSAFKLTFILESRDQPSLFISSSAFWTTAYLCLFNLFRRWPSSP